MYWAGRERQAKFKSTYYESDTEDDNIDMIGKVKEKGISSKKESVAQEIIQNNYMIYERKDTIT